MNDVNANSLANAKQTQILSAMIAAIAGSEKNDPPSIADLVAYQIEDVDPELFKLRNHISPATARRIMNRLGALPAWETRSLFLQEKLFKVIKEKSGIENV